MPDEDYPAQGRVDVVIVDKTLIKPIELTHRVAREANVFLSRINDALSQRTLELAASNLELKKEILQRKEVENFLLVPAAIDRAAKKKVVDRVVRSGISLTYQNQASKLLAEFAETKRAYVAAQMLTARRQFERTNSPYLDETTVVQASLETFDRLWANESTRLNAIPGKEALSAINTRLQELYGITVTATAIVDAMLIRWSALTLQAPATFWQPFRVAGCPELPIVARTGHSRQFWIDGIRDPY